MSKHSTFQIGFIEKKKKEEDDKKEDNNLHSLFQEQHLGEVRPTCFSSKLLQVPLLEKVGAAEMETNVGNGDKRHVATIKSDLL